MNDHGEAGPSFVWEIGEDLIDLDHWAHSSIELSVQEKEAERSNVVRYGYWPITVLVLVVMATTSSVAMAGAVALFVAVGFIGVRLWNRSAATRLAKRLHNIPAASEPFTFRADAEGTHSHSASGSEDLAWSRYRSVRIHDDLLVLALDIGMMRLLPVSGLTSGQPASTAVHQIADWIEAARSASAPTS
jgi:hypothetical protein